MNTNHKWAACVILNEKGSDLMYVEGEKMFLKRYLFQQMSFRVPTYMESGYTPEFILLPCEVERIH